MDPSWLALSTCGTLIVSWAGCPCQVVDEIEPPIDIGGQSIDHTEHKGSTLLNVEQGGGSRMFAIRSRGRYLFLRGLVDLCSRHILPFLLTASLHILRKNGALNW